MTIILDAMGSDAYPDPEIEGALTAAEKYGIEVILVGKEDILAPKLAQLNQKNLPVRIHHAPDVLEMEDKAVESTRKKPLNSMAVGLELVKSGEGAAFVTAGNTGAAMFNALRVLGRIKGVHRPALTTLFPTKKGHCVVLDIGANADCRPEFLQQFGILGSVFAETSRKIQNPRIGLISNGEEEGKGNQLVKEAYPLLKASPINFIGNLEGKELFAGVADVAVTDGFTGNVLLKASEAVAKMLTDTIKTELMSTTRTKIGALLVKPAFGKIKQMLDPAEVGAAVLLGIDGLVYVGHGRSDARAIVSGLRVAQRAVDDGLLAALREAVQKQLVSQE